MSKLFGSASKLARSPWVFSLLPEICLPASQTSRFWSRIELLTRSCSTQWSISPPVRAMRATSSTVSATHQDTQNKLLRSAELNLSTVGNWSLEISVRRGSQSADLSLPLNVVASDAGAGNRWPYLAFLVFIAILLFARIWRYRLSNITLNT